MNGKCVQSPLGNQLLKRTRGAPPSPWKHTSLINRAPKETPLSPRPVHPQSPYTGKRGTLSPRRTLSSKSPVPAEAYALYPRKRDLRSEIDYSRVKNIAKELNRLSHVRTYDSLKRKYGLRHLLIPKTEHEERPPTRSTLSPLLRQGSPMWKVKELAAKKEGGAMKDQSIEVKTSSRSLPRHKSLNAPQKQS